MSLKAPHIALFLVALVGIVLIGVRYSTAPRPLTTVVAPAGNAIIPPSDANGTAEPATKVNQSGDPAIAGIVEVIDADTFRLGNQRIRLFGIDAIEAEQRCSTDAGAWDCGSAATEALVAWLAGRQVVCKGKRRDRYQRLLAKCSVGNEDVGGWLVSHGWAFAFRYYSTDYIAAEEKAKADGLGLWKSKFVFPWEWRKNKQ